MKAREETRRCVLPLAEVTLADVSTGSSKNASLGEMIRELSPLGVRVPGGFAPTAEAFRLHLERAGIEKRVCGAVAVLDIHDTRAFYGLSIGSNDLTQLTLGVDRDWGLLTHLFGERDPGVRKTIEQVITAAHRKGRKVGICGGAPSNYPDFATWPVSAGIDSMSLNPDARLCVATAIARTAPVAKSGTGGMP